MTFFEQIRRFERLDYLIRSKSTGSPAQLARKLNVSESQVFQIMKIFREKFDAPVYYSKAQQSYCYEREVKFTLGFQLLEK